MTDSIPAHRADPYRLMVDHLHEGVMLLARDGTILACNPSAIRILRAASDLVGRRFYDLVRQVLDEEGNALPADARPLHRALASGGAMHGRTAALELANGGTAWVSLNLLPVTRPGEGAPYAVLVSVAELGPAREAQQTIRYLANHDVLTGAHSRSYLVQRLNGWIDNGRPGRGLGILFLDLDQFKKVNDAAGHDTGDALLHQVVKRLRRCVRDDDMVARVGSDEFVVVAAGQDAIGALTALAQKIVDAVAVPFEVAGRLYPLHASLGICRYPHDGRDVSTLLRRAESAMYAAKQSGHNSFLLFNDELNRRLERRHAIERLLRHALTHQEMSVHYQPIADRSATRWVGAEALLRWHSRELGPVPPAEFIPIAEETGLIADIGQWVLEHACWQAAAWQRDFAADFLVAVNLSPRQFQEALPAQVGRCLQRSGLAPAALELEITEGLLMSDIPLAQRTLRGLIENGIHISVDDFGTGYSSLSYLKRFSPHGLKIDRTFTAGLPQDRDAATITRAIVAMAHSLGMTVTAEGVETAEQAAFLRALGCDRLQGYLFGKPMSAAAMSRHLGRWQRAAA